MIEKWGKHWLLYSGAYIVKLDSEGGKNEGRCSMREDKMKGQSWAKKGKKKKVFLVFPKNES